MVSRYRIRYYIQEVLSIILLWITSALLCVYIKFNDIPQASLPQIYHFPRWMTQWKLYCFAVVIALVIGTVMGLAHTFLYPRITKTRSFVTNFLIKFSVFFLITFGTLSLFFRLSDLPALDVRHLGTLLVSPAIRDVFLYMVLVEVIVGMTITLRTNLGKNYLNKLLRNAYFTPKEEYRVFMFTDLKNSTSLVEEMGSLSFSRFIQDCFEDFSAVALDHGAEIYQFVGDEVVTTWLAGKHFDFNKCIALHFALRDRLEKRKKYYQGHYAAFPEFRSSVHCGKVSAALVGTYKSEIAYHGGVLNLCSRLQSVCRDQEAELIVSERFFSQVTAGPVRYRFAPVADIELKGISQKQNVYMVTLPV